jgi:exodeoxyribonuclease III
VAQHRIFSWNVNGVRAIEKKGFSNWVRNSQADVVMLQETKCSPEQVPASLSQMGYHAEWCSAEKKGYSGVATFTRTPVTATRGFGVERFDTEGRVLISKLPSLTLFNVYFPSGSRNMERVGFKLEFYKQFLAIITPLIQAGERVVVAGDVNTAYAEIDLARPKENQKMSGFLPEERTALGEFFQAGLVDTYRHYSPDGRKYSWWSQVTNARDRNIGWRLDYIFVSPNLVPYITEADIHTDVMGSDHCPVSVTLDLPD